MQPHTSAADQPRSRQDLLACALLAAILLALFGRAAFGRAVLAPTDAIFLTPFFAGETPPGFRAPGNPLLLDQVYQFVPWRRFAWQTLRAGHLPLWNPDSHAGAPFVATMQAAVFYPVNLLLLGLPFEQTFAWSAILKLWIAGTLTYLLARCYRLGWAASLVSALAFMLSSFLVVWLGHPHTNVAVWLPGILLVDELMLTASSRAKQVRYAALLAVVVAIQFTGGHPETSADVLVAGAMYHLLRWWQLIRPAAGPTGAKLVLLLVLPGASIVLGTALASIQLLPFLEWLPLSAEYQARAGAAAFQLQHAASWRYLFFLPLAIFPNLYGNPTSPLPPARSLLPWGQNFSEDVLYAGALPLVLALMALLQWRGRRPQVTVFAILGGVAIGRALHLPVFDWFNRLPVLDLGNPHRQRLIWCLSVAVLAGFGADAWWRGGAERHSQAARRWLRLNFVVVVLGVLLAAAGAVLPLMKGTLVAYGRRVAEREFAARADGEFPLSHYYERSTEAITKLLWSLRPDNLSMYLPALICAAAIAVTWWQLRRPDRRRRPLRLAVLALTSLDLLAFAWRYNPTVPLRDFYPLPHAASPITHDSTLFRFTATGLDLFPDAQMMYGLSDVRSMDFSTQWYNTYVAAVPETNHWISYGTTFEDFASPLLRVLNLKYVFSTLPGSPVGAAAADVVSATDTGRVWRLRAVQPRSYMVSEALVAPNDSQAVRALRTAPDAVFRRVVLSDAPQTAARAGRASAEGASTSVAAVRYGAAESVWRVQAGEPGYLVTTDAYYPGWHAYVDGVRTPVYRANIAFRAIEIAPGTHRVVYRYEPAWLSLAVTLGGLSALVIASGLAWSWATDGRRRGAG